MGMMRANENMLNMADKILSMTAHTSELLYGGTYLFNRLKKSLIFFVCLTYKYTQLILIVATYIPK